MIDTFRTRLQEPRFAIVLFTSLVSVLMAPHWPPLFLPAVGSIVLVIAAPAMATRPWLWWALAGLWTGAAVLRSEVMEDHVYLFCVWLVALGVCLQATTEESFVSQAAWHARVLIGTTFAFAVAWKFYFGTYLSGATLWVFMIADERFGPLARAVGLSSEVRREQRDGVSEMYDGRLESYTLDASDTVVWRIVAAAVATIAIEALIAISHLAPDSSRLAALRLPALVGFAVMTYAVVPVLPFAGLLAVLAMATARWRPEVMWVFPVLVAVPLGRFLTALLWSGTTTP